MNHKWVQRKEFEWGPQFVQETLVAVMITGATNVTALTLSQSKALVKKMHCLAKHLKGVGYIAGHVRAFSKGMTGFSTKRFQGTLGAESGGFSTLGDGVLVACLVGVLNCCGGWKDSLSLVMALLTGVP